MPPDSSPSEPRPPAAFGPAQQHIRHGSTRHPRGWQGATPPAEPGAQVAPRAPAGTIPRTTVAERLRQRLANEPKG